MAYRTIREVSERSKISRFTLAHAAKLNLLKEAAHQSGTVWLIDDEHDAFRAWLAAHPEQARVKGRKAKDANLSN